MNKYYSIFVLILILLPSCFSTNKLVKDSPFSISELSSENLNGNYSNISDSPNDKLWYKLYECYSFKIDTTHFSNNSIVKLDLKNDILVAKLYDNNILINEIEIKGVTTKNYFSSKRKLLFIPIPLFFIHIEAKVLLGITKNGNLYVKNGYAHEGWILIAAGGTNMIYTSEYEKKDLTKHNNK